MENICRLPTLLWLVLVALQDTDYVIPAFPPDELMNPHFLSQLSELLCRNRPQLIGLVDAHPR